MKKKVFQEAAAVGVCMSLLFCQPAFGVMSGSQKDIYGPRGYLATAAKQYDTKNYSASTSASTNANGRHRYGTYVKAHVYLNNAATGKKETKDYSNTRGVSSIVPAKVSGDVTKNLGTKYSIITCSSMHYVVKDGEKYTISL